MNNYTYRLWPLLNITETPAYMEWMEQKGLRFHKLVLFGLFAGYWRVPPQKTEYCWDYFEPQDFLVIQDYLDFYEAGGWEIAWQFEQKKVFRKIDAMDPPPLYTEEEMKQNRRRLAKKTEKWNCILFFFTLLVFTWIMVITESNWFAANRSWMDQFYVPSFVCGSFCLFSWNAWHYLQHCFGSGNAITFDRQRSIWCSAQKLAISALAVVFTVAALGDLFFGRGNLSNLIFLLYVISIPRQQVSFISANAVNYPKERHMKGVLTWSKKACRIAEITLLIVYIGLGAAALLYEHMTENEPVVTSNLQCSRIVAENMENWNSQRYYRARSKEAAKQVIKAFEEMTLGLWTDETYRQESLPKEIPSVFFTPGYAVPAQPWDEAYQKIYEGQNWLLIRSGLELWWVQLK